MLCKGRGWVVAVSKWEEEEVEEDEEEEESGWTGQKITANGRETHTTGKDICPVHSLDEWNGWLTDIGSRKFSCSNLPASTANSVRRDADEWIK